MKKVNMLTKAEMKNVMGGSVCTVFNPQDGTSSNYNCEGSQQSCQTTADANCSASQYCAFVMCS